MLPTFTDDRFDQQFRSFLPALILSIALHVLVLVVRIAEPSHVNGSPVNRTYTRLDATLSQAPNAIKVVPAPEPVSRARETGRKWLTAAPSPEVLSSLVAPKTWSRAERDDMEQFLSSLSAQPKPLTGQDLEQRALAMARSLPPSQEDNDIREMAQKLTNAKVERFSLEMYFDALFRKMNRSAEMVKPDKRLMGKQIAAVKIVVNKDGSVKSFTILWAADQQSEIAYIKAVVAQAAPFPLFPADIRSATDTIVLQVCIIPGRYADGSGASFSRMTNGQGCRSPDS